MLHLLHYGGFVGNLAGKAPVAHRHLPQTLPVIFHAGLLIAIRREADVQLQCELF
jgi:hypothetical protein